MKNTEELMNMQFLVGYNLKLWDRQKLIEMYLD